MRANIGWIILIISLFTLHAQSNISSTVATGQPLRAAGSDAACLSPEGNSIDITLSYRWHDHNCLRFDGGFADVAGSFASVGYSRSNLLRMREILTLSAEVGVRLREAKFSLSKPSLFGKPIQMGANFYGRRFYYNQRRESSIFEFPRNMPVFDSFPPDDMLRYIRRGYGVNGFAEYQFRDSFSSVGVAYNYDISSFRMLTQASYEYYAYVPYQYAGMDRLSGIRTSTLTPSFTYNTIDHPVQPTKGFLIKIATAVTGLGGDVQAIEPSVEVKYFRSGFRSNHVIGLRLRGRVLAGYGYRSQPPWDRYYMGGENDIRGFDTWSIGPIAYMPSTALVNILNADGTPRKTITFVNGVKTFVNATMTVPVLRRVTVGGDTNTVANFEYRIPLRRPWTLALFNDTGWNALSFPERLRLSPYRISNLDTQFPSEGFNGQFRIPPGVQMVRMSTGAEFQVVTHKFNAPLRLYFAINPLRVREDISTTYFFGRSDFPNVATYQEAVTTLGIPTPIHERRFLLGFAIGRTF
jgi:outer membrane protein insertion porin family